jgi:hypothetical protein
MGEIEAFGESRGAIMREIGIHEVTEKVKDLCITANYDLGSDVSRPCCRNASRRLK